MHDGFWPCVARTRVHMCIHYVYTLYICIYIYVYTHKYTRFSDTPARPIVDSTADLWVDRSKREEMIPLSPSRPHLGHVPFTNKASGGVFFFFFGTVLFLSCLRLISRVITNGDTRISAAFRFPLEEPLCVIQGRGSYFVIYLYLPVLRKWLENGVPEKNIACSRTPLFRNVFCQTVSKRSFSG